MIDRRTALKTIASVAGLSVLHDEVAEATANRVGYGGTPIVVAAMHNGEVISASELGDVAIHQDEYGAYMTGRATIALRNQSIDDVEIFYLFAPGVVLRKSVKGHDWRSYSGIRELKITVDQKLDFTGFFLA